VLEQIKRHQMDSINTNCITEAESADKVREAHASVDIPLEDVIEIKTVS